MKVTPLWASLALLLTPVALAQGTETSAASATTTSPASSCTASPIASLCSYKDPGPEFAVASDSRAFCWDYCHDHSPCNFVIFYPGNPNTGTGTCWLYPGEDYDPSAGSSDCGNPYLTVYGKPECTGGSPTSNGACAATASPSAIAEVCGYPTPGDCFDTCTASGGATDCLSQCAEADSCSYVVFNPHNPSNSPYASGTCWLYTNGTYDASSASTCSGAPEQYVYNNVCPKPSPSSSSSSPSPSSTSSSGGSYGSSGPSPSSSSGSSSSHGSTSASLPSGSSSSSSLRSQTASSSATAATSRSGTSGGISLPTKTSVSSASNSFSALNTLAISISVFLLLAL